MTLTEQIELLRLLTDNGLAEEFPDEAAAQLLNATNAELWQLADWPFTYTTTTMFTDANGAATLPASVRRIEAVRASADDGSWVLDQVGFEPDWPNWFPETPAEPVEPEGRPVQWCRDGQVLYVYPSGGAWLRVRHTTAPVGLDAGGLDRLPEEFHMGLVYGAAARLLRQQADETDRAGAFQAEYETVVDRMRDQLLGGSRQPFLAGGRRPWAPVRSRRSGGWGR